MAYPATPLWQLQARSAAPSVVRIRNLETSVTGPSDAWGRPNRSQPIRVSASISLDGGVFGPSSSTDTVASDTVHYGLLSKAILSCLDDDEGGQDLGSVVSRVWQRITGLDLRGNPISSSSSPFLPLHRGGIRRIELVVRLPKATLIGDGVSVTQVVELGPPGAICSALRLHDLRVATLIGVNDNERCARQMVVANLEVDRVAASDLDAHHLLTTEVSRIMAESSFETLEALAKEVAGGIARLLHGSFRPLSDQPSWGLRLSLEKPIAVVFADAACVEIYVDTADIIQDKPSQVS